MKSLKLIALLAAVAVCGVAANATVTDWQAGTPSFVALDVVPGAYDIGEHSGAISYEFMVNSNPDEQEPSMALMGTLIGANGPSRAGLKYEQWSPDGGTGTYGVTHFGVADHFTDVATAPGEDTHLVFVSEDGETDLYVNGVLAATMPAEITLSGIVGIGMAIRDVIVEDNTDYVDIFDGDIYAVAIYDTALTAGEIEANAARFAIPEPASMILLGLGGLLIRKRR